MRAPQTAPASRGFFSARPLRNFAETSTPGETLIRGPLSQLVASEGSQTPDGLQTATPWTLRILHSQFPENPDETSKHSPAGPQDTHPAFTGQAPPTRLPTKTDMATTRNLRTSAPPFLIAPVWR